MNELILLGAFIVGFAIVLYLYDIYDQKYGIAEDS